MLRFQLLGAVFGIYARVIHILIHWSGPNADFVWITVGKGGGHQWIS